MMYSGDDFYGDDETSGQFMGCEICGRYECPGECETPDEPDIDEADFIPAEAFALRCPECGSNVTMIGDYSNAEFAGYECQADDSHDCSALVVRGAAIERDPL